MDEEAQTKVYALSGWQAPACHNIHSCFEKDRHCLMWQAGAYHPDCHPECSAGCFLLGYAENISMDEEAQTKVYATKNAQTKVYATVPTEVILLL